MTEKKILNVIKKHIKFKKINKKQGLDKINKWDSLTHLNILFAIEKEFKIKFDINEINSFQNIEEIINSVKKKK